MCDGHNFTGLRPADYQLNTLRGINSVFVLQEPWPAPQKLESIISTFLSALNLAVIGSLVTGLMSTNFVFMGFISRRPHRSSEGPVYTRDGSRGAPRVRRNIDENFLERVTT